MVQGRQVSQQHLKTFILDFVMTTTSPLYSCRAFVAITNFDSASASIYTGLPSGMYCDVITGCSTDDGCTGKYVEVDGSGYAYVDITNREVPMMAIHVGEHCIHHLPS